jgi:hypothetical protein
MHRTACKPSQSSFQITGYLSWNTARRYRVKGRFSRGLKSQMSVVESSQVRREGGTTEEASRTDLQGGESATGS